MGFTYLDSIREVIEEGGGVGYYSFGNPPHTHSQHDHANQRNCTKALILSILPLITKWTDYIKVGL